MLAIYINMYYHSCASLENPPRQLIAAWKMKKKMILDVDTGVDDAQGIMLVLADPSVEILGITCCHGNTPLENVLKNTLRVLKVCNRLDVSLCPQSSLVSHFFLLYQMVALEIWQNVTLGRSRCIGAARSPCCPVWNMLEIIMERMALAMCLTQTPQA